MNAGEGLRRIRDQYPGDILRLNASLTRKVLLYLGVFGTSEVGIWCHPMPALTGTPSAASDDLDRRPAVSFKCQWQPWEFRIGAASSRSVGD